MKPLLYSLLSNDRLFPGAYFAADFTKRKYRLGGQRYSRFLDIPGASFTRASTGYALNALGRLVNYASGDLRQVDDRGLLCEGARTNLLLQSQTLGTTWFAVRSSISADAIAAPDGTLTADAIIEDSTAASTHYIHQTVNTTNTNAHTVSIYGKANTRTRLDILVLEGTTFTRTAQCTFNLSAGTASSVTVAGGATGTASIEALANGWYRCSIVFTLGGADTNTQVRFRLDDGSSTTYSGNGASGLYAWGAQLEAATGASSYIPTTASATRAADVAAITAAVTYPNTLFVEFERETDVNGNAFMLCIDDGTANERTLMANTTGNLDLTQLATGGVAQATLAVSGTLSLNTTYKEAARFSTNSAQLARNGTLATEDTSVTLPNSATAIRIGSNQAGAAQGFAYIRRVAIYSRAFTDAELQALTA